MLILFGGSGSNGSGDAALALAEAREAKAEIEELRGHIGGFALGPEPNEFLSVADRNTELGDNVLLTPYNAERTLLIHVCVPHDVPDRDTWTAPGDRTACNASTHSEWQWQRRNAAHDDWEDVTPIIRGEKGDRGDTGARGADGMDGEDGADGTMLPPYLQASTQFLASAAEDLMWESVNQVPIAGRVNHVLMVTGENDTDYRWRSVEAIPAISETRTQVDTVRAGLAGLEDAFPDPPVPDHDPSQAKPYVLWIPAASGRSTWVEATLNELNGQVSTDQIADNAVTADKLASDIDFDGADAEARQRITALEHVTADIDRVSDGAVSRRSPRLARQERKSTTLGPGLQG